MTRTLLLLLLVTSVAVARAEPTVIAVEGDDVYVDLGARDGVGAGTELDLLHEVVAKDPRTGAVLRDRFLLGTMTVIRSGDRLSVARAEPTLARRVLAGDRVRLRSAKRTFVDPWVARVEASRASGTPTHVAPTTGPAGQRGIDHVALARDAWRETLGRSPEDRIVRWLKLLSDDPGSPYRKVIENELVSLQAQAERRDQALAAARSVRTTDRDPRIAELAVQLRGSGPRRAAMSLAPLERTVPNQPIELSFLVRDPAAIGKAWLYVRPHGEPGFRRIELARDGDAYLRGTIEASAVKAGALEWYVEAAERTREGQAEPVIGSQYQPQVIEIDDEVVEASIASDRSHIDAHVDYVDFDGKLGKGFDQYYQAEIDFTYRFIRPVYAVRLGFGTLAGVGGPKDVIDADPMDRCRDMDGAGAYRCRRVNFSYVYSEVELRLRPNIALMLRPQAGLLTTDRRDGTTQNRCTGSSIDDCTFKTGLGGRARVRFGEEIGTNLIVGLGFTDGVGTLLEAAYHWLPHQVVPVQLTIQVTDQPVVNDFGVRLIGDVGLRQLSWFYPSLRVSYQARDIDHAGVSGGFAMNFDW